MARKFLSRISLLLIFIIIVSLILGFFSKLSIKGFSFKEIGAFLSIALGVFSFIKEKIFSKRTSWFKYLFQLVMVLLGVIILIPQLYTFFLSLNSNINFIIIAFYILLILIIAELTKNEFVSNSELRFSKKFFKGNFEDGLDEFKKLKRNSLKKFKKNRSKSSSEDEFLNLNELK